MPDLKPIDRDAIPRALAKAERYRFLNEPLEAESISRDVLAVDPDNQAGMVSLLLTLTDRFDGVSIKPDEAHRLAARLRSEFERAYYTGVVEERWAKALFDAGYPREGVIGHLRAAMEHFDAAHRLAPPANDDSALRWNSCIRLSRQIDQSESDSSSAGPDAHEPDSFEDDVPVR